MRLDIRKKLLLLTAMLLIILGIRSPMILIFPLWIMTYIYRGRVSSITRKLPGDLGFISAGVIYGLLIEVFAIINNLNTPIGERILLGQTPLTDLFYGFFYYLLFIMSWYFLLKKMLFTKKEVFFISGVYGIFVEETGEVFLRIFSTGIVGPLYAILVMFVYGVIPLLPLIIREESFENSNKTRFLFKYPITIIVLFSQWAIYGNFILPLLKRIV